MTRLVVPASADVVCSQCELVRVTKAQNAALVTAWATIEDLRAEIRQLQLATQPPAKTRDFEP
jgi:hypothetical protein